MRASTDAEHSSRSSAPLRFVMPLVDEGSRSWAWHVVVRSRDAGRVRELAAAGTPITCDQVAGWFKSATRRWPDMPSGAELDDFVAALNALRVTHSETVAEHKQRSPDLHHRLTAYKSAINVVATDLVYLLKHARPLSLRTFGENGLRDLAALAAAAQRARGIINAPEPPHIERVWHQAAELIEWHIRRILSIAGAPEPGVDHKGPVVRFLKGALEAVGEGTHEEGAIAKALGRSAEDKSELLTVAEVSTRGYVVIA